jgi:hypothetical protein
MRDRHRYSAVLLSGLCAAGLMDIVTRLLWLAGSPEQPGSTLEAVGTALVFPGLALVIMFSPIFRALGAERESIGPISIAMECALLWGIIYLAVHKCGGKWRARLTSRHRALPVAAGVVILAGFGVSGAVELLAPSANLERPVVWFLAAIGNVTGMPLTSSALLVELLELSIVLGVGLPTLLWLAATWRRK